jgi:hypothetical protein
MFGGRTAERKDQERFRRLQIDQAAARPGEDCSIYAMQQEFYYDDFAMHHSLVFILQAVFLSHSK